MRTRTKLLHNKHSGRRQPHEHTSYLNLLLLLIMAGVTLTVFTSRAFSSPGPQEGSIGLAGTVAGKPPTTAPTITQPAPGQRFDKTPVTIEGSCPDDALVEVFKNDIFAGSALCADDNTYSLEIDLLVGKNELIARAYDALSQAGPASTTVVVYYDLLPSQAGALSPLSFGGPQLLLNTDAVFRGSFPNETLAVPLDIIGGRPPFAVQVQWGDATNKMFSRSTNETFRATHAYARPGTYSVSVQATDADDRVAFLTVAAIINGQPLTPGSTAPTTPGSPIVQRLLVLWPLYGIVLAAVISFWLGEQREKKQLVRHEVALPS